MRTHWKCKVKLVARVFALFSELLRRISCYWKPERNKHEQRQFNSSHNCMQWPQQRMLRRKTKQQSVDGETSLCESITTTVRPTDRPTGRRTAGDKENAAKRQVVWGETVEGECIWVSVCLYLCANSLCWHARHTRHAAAVATATSEAASELRTYLCKSVCMCLSVAVCA